MHDERDESNAGKCNGKQQAECDAQVEAAAAALDEPNESESELSDSSDVDSDNDSDEESIDDREDGDCDGKAEEQKARLQSTIARLNKRLDQLRVVIQAEAGEYQWLTRRLIRAHFRLVDCQSDKKHDRKRKRQPVASDGRLDELGEGEQQKRHKARE